jgi:hypothetical protein
MKHIRTFESYKSAKAELKIINPEILAEAIKESVLQIGDVYKVRSMIDIPQSLINAYVKKVKDTTGKNLRQFFGDVEVAEELVKHITTSGLDIDKIPGNALMGGAQGQGQGQVQGQDGVQVDTQIEAQPETQVQAQDTQVEPQGQAQEGQAQEFEEPQAQVQNGQAQEEVGQEEEEEGQEEKEEGQEEEENELPL